MNVQPSHCTITSRLDWLIPDSLARPGSVSVQEITRHLQNKREKSVTIALDILRLRGQVQRVDLFNRFRLSPTQAAQINKHPN